jgi:hypothetical protein
MCQSEITDQNQIQSKAAGSFKNEEAMCGQKAFIRLAAVWKLF